MWEKRVHEICTFRMLEARARFCLSPHRPEFMYIYLHPQHQHHHQHHRLNNPKPAAAERTQSVCCMVNALLVVNYAHSPESFSIGTHIHIHTATVEPVPPLLIHKHTRTHQETFRRPRGTVPQAARDGKRFSRRPRARARSRALPVNNCLTNTSMWWLSGGRSESHPTWLGK